MANPKLPPRVHRVRRVVKAGVRFHFYAWRGGPKFWVDERAFPFDPAFYKAYADKIELPKPKVYMTSKMVDDFLSSGEMPKAERTRKDYRLWALRFAEAFKDDPAALFEEPASRVEVDEWRQAWAHSPKQYDYAGAVVTRILNWAKKGRKIREHHCDGFEKVYRADRSEIVWSEYQKQAVLSVAPDWIRRILIAACETGLRPGDLIRLSRAHIQQTSKGHRIQVRTNKRKITATIPVTPAMAHVIEETPGDRLLILTNASGEPLTEHRISEGLRQWRDKGMRRFCPIDFARFRWVTRLREDLRLQMEVLHGGWWGWVCRAV